MTGTQSVILSINYSLLSVELPCGCKLKGEYMQHCGQTCDWFQWSSQELERAGKHILDKILMRRKNYLQDTILDEDIESLNGEEPSAEVFVPASDFIMWLELERRYLGVKHPVKI